MTYTQRFTQIDAEIFKNCKRFRIPTFVVRSKANQHIANMMQNDKDLGYVQARDKFVAESRRDFQEGLSQYNPWKELDSLPLRIVSSAALYDFIKDFEERDIERETGVSLPAKERKGGRKRSRYIDKPELVTTCSKWPMGAVRARLWWSAREVHVVEENHTGIVQFGSGLE